VISRAQYIDTLLWFNVAFAYRDRCSLYAARRTAVKIPLRSCNNV